jgi:hypothetical protein
MKPTLHPLYLALLAIAVAVVVSSCGGSGSSSAVVAATPPATVFSCTAPTGTNAATLAVDAGPTDSTGMLLSNVVNQSYVTINVYVPGTVPGTGHCQTIDHVWVDTGSTGLRLFHSAFTDTLPQSQQGGVAVASCTQFINSYTWGALRTADVRIAGELASSVPIQVIGDSSIPATAPSSCSAGTSALSTAAQMGANGLLGIGLFQQDCGAGCVAPNTPPPAAYYTCPGGTCASVSVALAQQLQNVVGLFTTDNNGVLILLPAIPDAGQATAVGTLVFGVNTQTNNALGSAVVFGASSSGYINTTTAYGDMSEAQSYIDSGSNGWFFNDTAIANCGTSGFFCPPTSPTALSAMMAGATGVPTVNYNFNIADESKLNATFTAFNDLGGPSQTCTPPLCTFDWGLPFFYGRSVFTLFEQTTLGGTYGSFAATP